MNVFSGKRAIFECLFSSGVCGGRTALELCALDLVVRGTQFSMFGEPPRHPQREHRDGHHKLEKNGSVERHNDEHVWAVPIVQTATSSGSWWRPGSRGLCLRARGGGAGAAADLPIVGRQQVFRCKDRANLAWKERGGRGLRKEEEKGKGRPTEPQFLFLVRGVSGQQWCLTTKRTALIHEVLSGCKTRLMSMRGNYHLTVQGLVLDMSRFFGGLGLTRFLSGSDRKDQGGMDDD